MDATNPPEGLGERPDPGALPEHRPYEDTPALRRAREYGIDITLLEAMLDLSVEERLRMLDSSVAFVRALDLARERKP